MPNRIQFLLLPVLALVALDAWADDVPEGWQLIEPDTFAQVQALYVAEMNCDLYVPSVQVYSVEDERFLSAREVELLDAESAEFLPRQWDRCDKAVSLSSLADLYSFDTESLDDFLVFAFDLFDGPDPELYRDKVLERREAVARLVNRIPEANQFWISIALPGDRGTWQAPD